MGITVAEGEACGINFVDAFIGSFAANNHSATMENVFAEHVTWDWSDGFKGEGPPSSVFEQFAKTWGFMVSTALIRPTMIVDTTNSKVIMNGEMTINIDGGFHEAHLVQNPVSFVLSLDENRKVVSWSAYWNNEDPKMLQALHKVGAKLAAAQTA